MGSAYSRRKERAVKRLPDSKSLPRSFMDTVRDYRGKCQRSQKLGSRPPGRVIYTSQRTLRCSGIRNRILSNEGPSRGEIGILACARESLEQNYNLKTFSRIEYL